MKSLKYGLAALFSLQLATTAVAAPTGQDLGANWCSDVKMHFYAGGPERLKLHLIAFFKDL